MKILHWLWILALTLSAAAPVSAQGWPTRPIQVIVPFLPGSVDSKARIVTEKVGKILGQPLVMVGCGILHKEIDYLIKKNGWNIETQFLDSALHNYFNKLYDLSNEVLGISKFQIAPSKPVIGERAFTRESGMGVDLVKTQPLALFGVTPSFVGQQPRYVLGKKSGLASVDMKLDDLGMPKLDDEKKALVLNKIKTLSLQKRGLVSDEEFVAIVKEVN